MSLKIAVLKEVGSNERRVAMVPVLVKRLTKLGASLALQTGAGVAAGFADADYVGATTVDDPLRVVADADIVLAVQAPSAAVLAAMKPGAALASFVYPQKHADLLEPLCERQVSAFALETVPRISRAQALDALSSQATLAGYYAPLLGAVHLPRILPMMTTAVGSLRAARVLVMGLGVAGLQALATAHRLGAITEGYDVRPETKEQAQSVGAKFVDTGVDGRGEGGYARELTAEEQARTQEALTLHIQQADLVITTANVPGRTAPRLISRAQIEGMKPGSVIVDLAAESGGNCEGTVPGETTTVGRATILAPLNVPSLLAQHASELYAKNLLSLLDLIVKDGALSLDLGDEVVAGTLLTHAGEIRQPAARRLVENVTP
ncbi:NAD(P) transhydrogenase subunit alpha [Luteibacter sp. UNCMF366Tsu5.1]|uniref:NAD(P) transhydrogenase subunit alpha n=1 Tax=Luteibacter sp. UNCMF366Tsu5.1 TaxID=1502758 RepID=UPI000908A2A5|nr:NAD(P) transhydrogenase subunit alpha [Luteibacter sp. UNCMF366Tsu5.1]SFW23383.1 NAD(P) transhydrogenase subunit alpha [Luteibacter sp. UNCMF366Tsu5.1]